MDERVPNPDPRLSEASEMELLHALLTRVHIQTGPSEIIWTAPPMIATIGIGRDHHADVVLGRDDLTTLINLLSGSRDVYHKGARKGVAYKEVP